jgi:hypothetical protein
MENDPTKTCKHCGAEKPVSEMEKVKKPNGKVYVRTRCVACARERNRTWKSRNPVAAQAVMDRAGKRQTLERSQRQYWAKWIVRDSRASDRKHGRKNDMTVEFVQQLIEGGCSYCGETELRMTLDRIDNTLGHTRENVVAACIRCNYTRKDMPHEAWVLLAPAMRSARECGLFGSWTGRTR